MTTFFFHAFYADTGDWQQAVTNAVTGTLIILLLLAETGVLQ